MEQLTIFDYMQPKSLEDMTEKEMVEHIGRKLNKVFTYNDFLEHWECKLKLNYKLDLKFDNYCTTWGSDEGNGARFISAGYGNHMGGGGRPCDTLDEAITYLSKAVEKINEEAKKKGK
jgi:hypothetical protein